MHSDISNSKTISLQTSFGQGALFRWNEIRVRDSWYVTISPLCWDRTSWWFLQQTRSSYSCSSQLMFIYHSRRLRRDDEHVSWNAPRVWCLASWFLASWCPNRLTVVPLDVQTHSSICIKIVIIKEWSKHRWSLRESFQHFVFLGFSNSPFCQQAADGVVRVLRICYIGNLMQSDSWHGHDLLLVSIESPMQFSLISQSDTAKLRTGCNHANSDHWKYIRASSADLEPYLLRACNGRSRNQYGNSDGEGKNSRYIL
jgi:hypothetical protein